MLMKKKKKKTGGRENPRVGGFAKLLFLSFWCNYGNSLQRGENCVEKWTEPGGTNVQVPSGEQGCDRTVWPWRGNGATENFGKRIFSSQTATCNSALSLTEMVVTEGKKPAPFVIPVNPGLENPRELAPKKRNPLHNYCTFSISPLNRCSCSFRRICRVCWTSS